MLNVGKQFWIAAAVFVVIASFVLGYQLGFARGRLAEAQQTKLDNR